MESRFAALLIALAVAALGWFLLIRGGVTGESGDATNSQEALDQGAPGASSRHAHGRPGNPTLRASSSTRRVIPAAVEEVEDRPRTTTLRVVVFSGVVLDTHQRPIRGATVSAKRFGKVIASVNTGDDGRYSFRVAVRPMRDRFSGGTVIARGPTGEVGYETFYYRDVNAHAPGVSSNSEREEQETIAPIILHDGGSIQAAVTMQCRKDEIDKGPPARVWIVRRMRRPARDDVIAVDYTDDRGHVLFEGLEAGRYRVITATPHCGRDSTWAELQHGESATVTLTIPESRTLTVRVLDKESKKPIAGARVVAQEQQVQRRDGHRVGEATFSFVSTRSLVKTDKDGLATFLGLGKHERVLVRASAVGFMDPVDERGNTVESSVLVASGATAATVYLQAPRTVTWKILDGGIGVPPDGTHVIIRALDSKRGVRAPEQGVIHGGLLSIRGWPPQLKRARAQVRVESEALFGFAHLAVRPGSTEGIPTTFFPGRTLRVHVFNHDGTPAPRMWVHIRDGTVGMSPNAITDESGFAAIADLPGDSASPVKCYVSQTSRVEDGWILGTWNLQDGDREVEFTLPGKRIVQLALRVQGKTAKEGIRGEASFRTAPKVQLVDDPSGVFHFVTNASGVAEIPVMLPSSVKQIQPWVRVTGHKQPTVSYVTVPADGPVRATIDLDAGFAAEVEVILAPDEGPFSWIVQRSADGGATWEPVSIHGLQFESTSTKGRQIHTIWLPRAGTYRALDGCTETATPAFTVGPGMEKPVVSLDLSKTAWVSGRVIVPKGYDVSQTTVSPVGRSVSAGITTWVPAKVYSGVAFARSQDGSFRVRVTSGKATRLRAYHPTLRPHATRGYASVRGAKDRVQLQMEESGVARLSLDRPISNEFSMATRMRVVLTPVDQPRAQEVLVGFVHADRMRIDFRGFVPGQYHLWVDTLTFAPIRLRNVTLANGVTELGSHPVSAGATVRVRVRSGERAASTPVTIYAARLGVPSYMRFVRSYDDVLELSGLGAGRFQITGSPLVGGRRIDAIIETDGKGAVELDAAK